MDSDRILVLSAGKVVEFDAPENVDNPSLRLLINPFSHLLIIVVSYYGTKILYSMASPGNQDYCRRLVRRHLGAQPHQVKDRARGGRNRVLPKEGTAPTFINRGIEIIPIKVCRLYMQGGKKLWD